MRRSLLIAALVLLACLLVIIWKEGRRIVPKAITPALTGQVEYCLTCHADLPEISASHPVQSFGCVLCHGGERLALEADLAHSTMRGGKNPSELVVVEVSCGGESCHSGAAGDQRDHIQRVASSIQATYAGAIAIIRYTFGEQPDLKARLGIYAIQASASQTDLHRLEAFDVSQAKSPAVRAFGEKCLVCHLSTQPMPGEAYARYAGCAACHTPLYGQEPAPPGQASDPPVHRLTTAIPYTQCNTCHNRGNYDLRDMAFHPRADRPTDRIGDYYQPIAQFVRCEWTLDCVDCHTRREAMGDGSLYHNQSEARYIRCSTCHGTLEALPLTTVVTDPDGLAMRMAFLNPVIDLKAGDTILVTEKGEPLWNTRRLSDGTYELFGKATGQRFTFRPVKGTACLQKPNEQESSDCHACHAVER